MLSRFKELRSHIHIMPEDYNATQKWLVENCERMHEAGIRHTGLSGNICEDMLMEKLRLSIPDLKFSRGVIKLGFHKQDNAWVESEDLSTQIDVIVYAGEPDYELEGCVVIPLSKTRGIIEVKKWSTPKMLRPEESVASKLMVLKREFAAKSTVQIPVLFVTYRFHDRSTKDVNWFTESKGFPADRSYCFYGGLARNEKRNLYPWEESTWGSFNECPYAGQYEKLVSVIRALAP